MSKLPATPAGAHHDADAAFAHTLKSLLTSGTTVQHGASKSVGANKESRELLNFAVQIDNPVERVVRNPKRSLNLPAAVARFVWMMAGNDRLADIAFYEPRVARFTDDGVTVPGSSYGRRMLQPRPGLDQLAAVVRRLQDDPTSRRAAMAIYHPEDAVRDSNDIPCAFGVFYHVRDGGLSATTVMRSNNSFVLMPYNLFEFSLLAEVVAAELGVELRTLTHFAASMHIFSADLEAAQQVVAAAEEIDRAQQGLLPRMPPDAPLEQVKALVRLEADLRHGAAAIDGDNIESWLERGEKELNNYWRHHYLLLLVHVAKRNKSREAIESIRGVLQSPWRDLLPPDYFALDETERGDIGFLELPERGSTAILALHDTKLHRALRTRVAEWEKRQEKVTWQQFVTLESHFAAEIAARGDRSDIPWPEFEAAMQKAISDAQE